VLVSTRRGSDRQARPPAWHQRQYLTIALVLVAVALYFNYGEHLPVPGAFGDVGKLSGQAVFNQWIWTAAIVTSFYFVFGVAGRFAFSTAAFVGLGAYVSHAVTRESDLSWAVGFLVAVVVASLLAFAFAALLRNAQHFYFAVATLGLSEVLIIVFRQWTPLTGRSSGEIVSAQRMSIFGWEVLARDRQFWVLLALLALVLFLGALMARSPVVRNAIAARDNARVVDTLGADSRWPGVVLFTLGSALAAAAGSIFVHTRGIGTPETFGIELGIGVFVALILGGLHSLWGGLIGAWFYIYVPLYLRRWESWTQVIWGGTLVFVMIVFPDGLVGLFTRLKSLLVGRDGPAKPPAWEPLVRLFGRDPEPAASEPRRSRVDEDPAP
jgi:branched-chain amino acid transport system permease protein